MHEVENLMYVGQQPWHKLGRFVEVAPTLSDAIILAGLDWKVRTFPMTVDAGQIKIPVKDHFAVVRETDASVLGVVGSNYTPLQNIDAFNFFDPFLKAGVAKLETAGSLRHGQRVWVLAEITGDNLEIIKNDYIKKYLLLSNSHDGKMTVRVGFTPVRVVCANTLAASHSNADSKLLRVYHGRSVAQNVGLIKDIINCANQEFEATAEQYRFLASKQLCKSDLEKYVKKVFKLAESPESKRGETMAQRTIDNIVRLFESGRGADIPGVRGTYWGAYNAVTELINHERGRSDENRLHSVWFGGGKLQIKESLEIATAMAKAA